MNVRCPVNGLSEVAAAAFNTLSDGAYPFLRHEFLLALETRACLGERVGWIPQHLLVEGDDGTLLAALPMYLKDNSFGEFVFDGSWADAYRRAGLAYYPKLVVAAPFTPATGPRLLLHPQARGPAMAATVLDVAIEAAEQWGVSSLHWLFANDAVLAESPRLMSRMGCQFHWQNQGYSCFDDFLSRLTSKRRKEILRERRQVREAGITVEQIAGTQVTAADWRAFFALYRDTFDRHGNYPALTLSFFQALASQMGDQVRLVVGRRQGRVIAAAYFLVGTHALYGRYWGCQEDIPGLHFELCYYQGIDYCIASNIARFEPGAQGEHKVSRGFLPTPTWSYHWIAEPGFQAPIARFLTHERHAVEHYIDSQMARSPYRAESC
jgi:predicted N-acyltransferase